MRFRKAASLLACGFGFLGVVHAFQRPFRQYPGVEYRHFETPQDWNEPFEFAFATKSTTGRGCTPCKSASGV
jgi:hypothetical protein